jgi:hypothetical protein
VNPHITYLAAGYLISAALFVGYRAWIGARHRALTQQLERLEREGARLEEEA